MSTAKRVKQINEEEILQDIKNAEFELVEKLLDNDRYDDQDAVNLQTFDGLMQFVTNYRQKTTPLAPFQGTLYEYQKESLAWMLDREMATKSAAADPSSRWKKTTLETILFNETMQISVDMLDVATTNNVSITSTSAGVPNVSGGILADEMGLGKTVQMIALICTNPPSNEKQSQTLVVVPKSLLQQWEKEIKQYAPKLKVYIYHGQDREVKKISKSDVVITTYQTLANDIEKLGPINWWRIILDEAHIIRNSLTNVASACFQLQSRHRWALTGTPIHNGYRDLFSLFKFLRVRPYGEIYAWYNLIEKPLTATLNNVYAQFKDSAFTRLRDLVKELIMRRTKNTEATDIRLMVGAVVSFPSSNQLWEVTRMDVENFSVIEKNTNDREYSVPYLTTEYSLQRALVYLPPKNIQTLVVAFDDEHRADYDILRDEAVLRIDNAQQQREIKNPLVHILRMQQFTIHPYLVDDKEQRSKFLQAIHNSKRYDRFATSPKIDAVIKDLSRAPSDVKSLIFSRFTGALDILEIALEKAGWINDSDYVKGDTRPRFVRIDGSKTPDERADAIDKITNNNQVKLMLLQLQTAGVGLNLVRASNVYFLEPFFSGAVHAQAIDRVHRIGQTRPVNVKMVIMNDTLEANILKLQDVKNMITNHTLRPLSLGLEQIRSIITAAPT